MAFEGGGGSREKDKDRGDQPDHSITIDSDGASSRSSFSLIARA